MKPIFVLLFTMIFFSCDYDMDENIIFKDLPPKTLDAQIEILSVLTGNQPMNADNIIRSRATIEERRITVNYLSQVLKQLNLEPIKHQYKEPNTNPLIDILIGPYKGTNLFTILPSTNNSNEYVVLGAHYDTARNCPGANDNASSLSVLYGVTKRLSNVDLRNKNILVVFFDQEEENLVGSKAFVKYLLKHKYQVHSVHTLDQIGWDKDGDRAIELELPTPELKKLYKNQGAKLNIPIHTTNVNSTDHHSFRQKGFTAVGITEEYVNGDTTPFKDSKDDTMDTIDFEYIDSTTNLIFEVINDIVKSNKHDLGQTK
ncbi:MAG: M28 family peptidase [Flavobacteriaceae bacterium]|nr:M28 family peptidase [Flavobacteriaceae bacterium]